MTNKAVAIDAKVFRRKSSVSGKSFNAPFGVAVNIKDYDSFSVKYLDTIDKLKLQYGITSRLKILKSYDILRTLHSKGQELMDKVVYSLNGEIESTSIYYTTIPEKKIPKVKISRN